MTVAMSRRATILVSLAAAVALTAAAAAAEPVFAAEPCLAGSPLSDVRRGTAVADKTGRWVGRVDSIHCRRGFRDAQLFVATGRLRNQTLKIFRARSLRMVGVAVFVPLTRAEIDALPGYAVPEAAQDQAA
jgi:hypothetical protein